LLHDHLALQIAKFSSQIDQMALQIGQMALQIDHLALEDGIWKSR